MYFTDKNHATILTVSSTIKSFINHSVGGVTVVRTPVLAGELSLSCTGLRDGCLTTLWVKRPLSVNQQGQLSLPSLRGRLNE